jgi:hypothetical protein
MDSLKKKKKFSFLGLIGPQGMDLPNPKRKKKEKKRKKKEGKVHLENLWTLRLLKTQHLFFLKGLSNTLVKEPVYTCLGIC